MALAARKALHSLDRQSTSFWSPEQLAYLELIKASVIGAGRKSRYVGASPRFPQQDSPAILADPGTQYHKTDCWACSFDCYRRATMLEPIVVDILRAKVKGDFLEAGVYLGGISIALMGMLHATGQLGRRKVWFADSFQGLPPEGYSSGFAKRMATQESATELNSMIGRYGAGKLSGTLSVVQDNVRHCLKHVHGLVSQAPPNYEAARFLPGFFNETLRNPRISRLALLRLDGDLYASVYEALEALYPRLSIGGYVVIDDWKLAQARGAVLRYRERYNVTEHIWSSRPSQTLPFQTLDTLAFWMKREEHASWTEVRI